MEKMMNIQEVIAAILGIIALIFIVKKIFTEFTRPQSSSKCDKCPVTKEFDNKAEF